MDLENAYRELPAQGSLKIPCAPGDVPRVLAAAERAGFHGLRVENGGITAWKGKAGPCHDTGRTAAYRGSAAAALDDDRHLLTGKIRVCEKTARILASAPYGRWTAVSEANPSLLARLGTDPAPFDCDTFQSDAEALARTLPAGAPAGPSATVFYPGPFRLLILSDGTLVRRGRWTRVGREAAGRLAAQDGAEMSLEAPGEEPGHLAALFQAKGAACLLDDLGDVPRGGREAKLSLLADASGSMRHRLRAMIERGDPYFILTGSDPSKKDGCCPSNEVGEANLLVRGGVLEALDGPPNASCPVTIYAFAGEILRGPSPDFKPNPTLRASVDREIRDGRRLTPKIALRAGLLILAVASVMALAYGVYRHLQGAPP